MKNLRYRWHCSYGLIVKMFLWRLFRRLSSSDDDDDSLLYSSWNWGFEFQLNLNYFLRLYLIFSTLLRVRWNILYFIFIRHSIIWNHIVWKLWHFFSLYTLTFGIFFIYATIWINVWAKESVSLPSKSIWKMSHSERILLSIQRSLCLTTN